VITSASGTDCHGALRLSNGTGLLGFGGYTLELQTDDAQNASFEWLPALAAHGDQNSMADLLPSLDIELHAVPFDTSSQARIHAQGSMTFRAWTQDVSLFLLRTALALAPPGASCFVPEEQLAYSSIRVSSIVYATADLAFKGDWLGAVQEFSQVADEFFTRAGEALKEVGLECAGDALKGIAKKPFLIAKIGLAYITWVPVAIYDYFKYQGRPAYITFEYSLTSLKPLTPMPSATQIPSPAPTQSTRQPTPTIWVRPTDGAVMVFVPAGEFLMGSTRESEPCAYADDMPQHRVYLDGYWIDKYEVTNGQFAQFVQATGYKAEGDWRANFTPGKERYPVVNVSWNDATAYAKWVGGQLPTEAQWEKAARGADGRVYPWGNEWDPRKANVGKGWSGSPAPVGDYPGDVSPYGCQDMAGNIMEWVFDWYGKYDGAFQHNPTGPVSGFARMLRGGSFLVESCNARCAARNAYFHQNDAVPDVGFRTVLVPPVWQPDRIAYVGWPDQNIWLMNSDGSGKKQIIADARAEGELTWSPDGSKIAFIQNCSRPGGSTCSHVVVANADGTGRFDLTPTVSERGSPPLDSWVSWSPDGTKIAYSTTGQIYLA